MANVPGIFNPYAPPESEKETFKDVYERAFPDTVHEIGIPPMCTEWSTPKCALKAEGIEAAQLPGIIFRVIRDLYGVNQKKLQRNGIDFETEGNIREPKHDESRLTCAEGAIYVYSIGTEATREDEALLRICQVLPQMRNAREVFQKYKVSIILYP